MTYISKAGKDEWKYPATQAATEGHLRVSDDPPHEIYWHAYGNPHGEPVMFLHGGPGGGSDPVMARFFDPARYRVILFDQRGCGKSTPLVTATSREGLRENTTADLIGDIEKLRDKLNIKGKMHVFGGSWGSTLALAYAERHPAHVQSLILRGIFLCRKKDIDYFYQGNAANLHDTKEPGAYMFFPEAWREFVSVIPAEKRSDMVKAYAEIFEKIPKTPAEHTLQDRAARAWSIWEGITSYLAQDTSDLGKFDETEFAHTFARIENHYFMNGAFLGGKGGKNRDTNYLLEHIGAIAHIPIHIVQGQYDQVCPRFQADALVDALKSAGAKDVHYMLTPAGHSMMERETRAALTDVMDNLPAMSRLDKNPPATRPETSQSK